MFSEDSWLLYLQFLHAFLNRNQEIVELTGSKEKSDECLEYTISLAEEKGFSPNNPSFFKSLVKKGIPLHPQFILNQIAKFRQVNTGRTLMYCAVRRVTKRSKVKDIKAVELLCSLGYPMYEANVDGESIFFEVFSP